MSESPAYLVLKVSAIPIRPDNQNKNLKTTCLKEPLIIQERIQKAMNKQPCNLLGFQDTAICKASAIPFELNDYIALVDWSGRTILENKRGSIPINTPPILTRLGIDEKD